MLNLVYGKAKSGKTSFVKNKIKSLASGGTENIIYIVPEQNSFKAERDMLTLFGDDSNGIVERVIHFKRLAKKIIELSGLAQKPLIDDNCRRVYMSMAVESVSDYLDIFSKCSKSGSVGGLIGILNEFSQCNVSMSELKNSALLSGDEILIKKTTELALIIETYKALIEKSFSDGLDEMTLAAKLAGENDYFKGKTVFIDEFSGFTAQEYELIKQIGEKCDNIYITLCLDNITEKKYKTDVFYYTQNTAQRLFALAKKANIPFNTFLCDYEYTDRNSPFYTLKENIYSPLKEQYKDFTDKITVTACENISAETNYVAMTIKKLVREKGYRYRDFAVIQRGTKYDGHFNSALKKYGIPVFDDNRHLLKNENIIRLVTDAIACIVTNFNTEYVLKCAKTSLFSIEKEDIEELENYVLIWQINNSKWLTQWQNHPDGYGIAFDEKVHIKLDKINKTRVSLISPLLKLKEELTDADGFAKVKAIYDFLINIHADENLLKIALELYNKGQTTLAVECERVWDEFNVILDKFANTIGNNILSVSRFYELFTVMIDNADTGEIPQSTDSITIGDALRIRLEDKKVVFIIGANEGLFPAMNEASFVLTKKERRKLESNNTELYEDGEIFASKERYLVYYAVTRQTENLFVTYSASDGKGSTLTKSEIVSEIISCIPNCKKIENAFIPLLDRAESDEACFEVTAEHFTENNAEIQSLKEYLYSKPEYSGKMKALERAAEKQQAKITSKEIATELFGKNMRLSPSGIEKYNKCPFMYFCLYGIGAKKIKKAELAPNIRGLAIHEVLEKMFTKFPSDILCTLSDEQLKSEIHILFDNYINEKMGGKKNTDKRMLYSLSKIENSIFEVSKRLIFEFSHCEFVTDAMELEIKNGNEIEEYTLELENGGSISLHGVVDRADKYEKDGKTYIRVVDYKTGGKEFNLNDTVSGLNLQMLIYLMCLWQNGGKRYGDNIVPAGILYLPAKGGVPKLDRHDTEERVQSEKISQGQMNGMILCTSEVMNAMDTTGEGVLLSNKLIKDGKPGRYAVTMRQMTGIFNKIDKVIISTAENMQKGKIDIYPMLDGTYKNTCEYCDYKSVCCFEEGDEHNTITKCEDDLLKGKDDE